MSSLWSALLSSIGCDGAECSSCCHHELRTRQSNPNQNPVIRTSQLPPRPLVLPSPHRHHADDASLVIHQSSPPPWQPRLCTPSIAHSRVVLCPRRFLQRLLGAIGLDNLSLHHIMLRWAPEGVHLPSIAGTSRPFHGGILGT